MSKFYKNITTILIILVLIIIVAASFSLSVSARVVYDRFDSVISGLNANWTYGFTNDPSTLSSSSGFINPFVYSTYIIDGKNYLIPATSIKYDNYVWFKTTDNPSINPYVSATLATSAISFTGYYNAISIDLLIPCAANYLDQVSNAPLWLSYGNQLSIEPDERAVFVSGPYKPASMVGAPVKDSTFYLVSFSLYFDEPIYIETSTILNMSIPVAPFDFTTATVVSGIVCGLNDIEFDYYESLEEAQNAKIIDLIQNSPNGVEYTQILGKVFDQVQDALSSIEIEDMFYDQATQAIPDQLNSSAQIVVDDIWGSMSFIWHPWIVGVILTIIPIAVLSYALYGKAG